MSRSRATNYLSVGYQHKQRKKISSNINKIIHSEPELSSKTLGRIMSAELPTDKDNTSTDDKSIPTKDNEDKIFTDEKDSAPLNSILHSKIPLDSTQILKAAMIECNKLIEQVRIDIIRYKMTDNTIILSYCRKLILLFQITQHELLNRKDQPRSSTSALTQHEVEKWSKHLEKIIAECIQQFSFLQHAINITIYQVKIPEDKLQGIMSESERFYNNDTGVVVAAKFAGAVIGWFPSIVGAWFNTATTAALCEKNIDRLSEINKFGYAFKQGFPLEWIFHPDNKSYIESKRSRTLYVLDARNPQELLEQGLYYLSKEFNPNTYTTIGFFDLEHAEHCARSREDGLRFHPQGGWKIHEPWTDSQIEQLSSEYILKNYQTLLETTPDFHNKFPKVLLRIIAEYAVDLGFFAPQKKSTAASLSEEKTESQKKQNKGSQL